MNETIHATPIGPIRVVERDGAIERVELCDEAPSTAQSELLQRACAQLDAYFAGTLTEFDLPLRPVGTTFERAAWSALQRIPYGETRSYSDQANAIGNPKAVRAIGRANGKNPIAIVIPCHRAIGKDGKLVGFAMGLDRKRFLLDLEGR